ncbi:hypothetical protein ACFL2C_02620 [Patescibacteria group bacterium]
MNEVITPSAQVVDQNYTDTNHTPKPAQKTPNIIKVISAILIVISIFYVFNLAKALSFLLISSSTLYENGLTMSISSILPNMNFIVLFTAVVSIANLYAGFKVRSRSLASYWIALVVCFVTLLFAAVNVFWATTILESALVGGESESPLNPLAILLDIKTILSFIVLVLVVFTRKIFTHPPTPFSKAAKIFFVIYSIAAIFMSGYFFVNYTKPKDNVDQFYSEISQKVDYHIYKPDYLPDGLVQAIHFKQDELGGIAGAVRVVYDVPEKELLETGNTNMIVMTQVGVNTDFDLEEFANTYVEDVESVDPIKIPLAKTNKAYHLSKEFGNSRLNFLVFVTSDNVLISIGSPTAKLETLMSLATALK